MHFPAMPPKGTQVSYTATTNPLQVTDKWHQINWLRNLHLQVTIFYCIYMPPFCNWPPLLHKHVLVAFHLPQTTQIVCTLHTLLNLPSTSGCASLTINCHVRWAGRGGLAALGSDLHAQAWPQGGEDMLHMTLTCVELPGAAPSWARATSTIICPNHPLTRCTPLLVGACRPG